MVEFQQTTKELNTCRVLILCAIVILLEGFDTQKLSVLEKIGYSLGDAGANFVFKTMIMFQLFSMPSSWHV